MNTTLHRRSFLAGLFAAPAIVKASSIMPVKAWGPLPVYGASPMFNALEDIRWIQERIAKAFYLDADLMVGSTSHSITRRFEQPAYEGIEMLVTRRRPAPHSVPARQQLSSIVRQ